MKNKVLAGGIAVTLLGGAGYLASTQGSSGTIAPPSPTAGQGSPSPEPNPTETPLPTDVVKTPLVTITFPPATPRLTLTPEPVPTPKPTPEISPSPEISPLKQAMLDWQNGVTTDIPADIQYLAGEGKYPDILNTTIIKRDPTNNSSTDFQTKFIGDMVSKNSETGEDNLLLIVGVKGYDPSLFSNDPDKYLRGIKPFDTLVFRLSPSLSSMFTLADSSSRIRSQDYYPKATIYNTVDFKILLDGWMANQEERMLLVHLADHIFPNFENAPADVQKALKESLDSSVKLREYLWDTMHEKPSHVPASVDMDPNQLQTFNPKDIPLLEFMQKIPDSLLPQPTPTP